MDLGDDYGFPHGPRPFGMINDIPPKSGHGSDTGMRGKPWFTPIRESMDFEKDGKVFSLSVGIGFFFLFMQIYKSHPIPI